MAHAASTTAAPPPLAALGSSGVAGGLPLVRRAIARRLGGARRPRILLWEASDERVRSVGERLAASGFAEPVALADEPPAPGWSAIPRGELVGRRPEGRRRPEPPRGVAELAAAALSAGLVDGVVGGAVTPSPDVLRAGLRFVGAERTVSIAFFVRPASGPRGGDLLLLADAGVVPRPDAAQLYEIALASADTWEHATGTPAVLALLGVATKSRGGRSEIVAELLERLRAARPGIVADGELQADAAVSPAVAAVKDPGGPAAGSANVLVFPSLESANIAYKLLQRVGDASVLCVTQGFRRPFYDVSRGCDEEELLGTVLYCAARASGLRDAATPR